MVFSKACRTRNFDHEATVMNVKRKEFKHEGKKTIKTQSADQAAPTGCFANWAEKNSKIQKNITAEPDRLAARAGEREEYHKEKTRIPLVEILTLATLSGIVAPNMNFAGSCTMGTTGTTLRISPGSFRLCRVSS
jgi:hypothetical protein